MATIMLTRKESLGLSVERSLLVIWKHPETRRSRRVGKLDHLTDGRFAFSYLDESRDAADFRPLVAFPDMDSTYVSENLPPFFRNRVMNSGRPDYEEFLGWLGLDSRNPDLPIEILARTGGPRATDTFHIVDAPNADVEGVVTRFFVSGVNHCEGALDKIQSMAEGAELSLRPEPSNPYNPHAVLIDESDDSSIGWVPDWLLTELQPLIHEGATIRVFADRVNLDAPAHLSVLCRLERYSAGR
ncbi:HIRAN domain-containing protein [Arthrobacter sp. TWP1-1]|uniref:HIRAN domain-containing protein n=1 Tax=Arthrobacter sp. TWP1-1 TaxID=2804568 RepID=UPI003CEFA789